MCQACTIKPMDSDAFAGKLLGIINSGSLAMMISIGHRTGLFDVMSEGDSFTSEELAKRAKLNERYVREWLGAMTVGGIVIPNESGTQFSLPDEHAKSLTRKAGADNMAVFSQYLSVLGGVEDRIVECFEKGGGVSYSEFPRFHEVMAEDSGQSVTSSLFEHVLPLMPEVVSRLEEGIEVLDIGCGRGMALMLMAKQFPDSQFTGYDLSGEALEFARNLASEKGLKNIRFEQRDLTNFNTDAEAEKFDFITSFDAIHDQARPDNVLSGIHQSLRPGGTYMMQDIAASSNPYNNIDHPLAPFIYTISCMHCMTVSLAQDGMGLGAAWGREKAIEMLGEAGFEETNVNELEHDVQNYYYVSQKSAIQTGV